MQKIDRTDNRLLSSLIDLKLENNKIENITEDVMYTLI